MKGFFAIGIEQGKTVENFGTLIRSAKILGATFVFTVGRRFKRQPSDTMSAWRTMPIFEFSTIDDLVSHLPYACLLIGVEIDERAKPIEDFTHPERACYILGSEDNGLSKHAIERCHTLIRLPGERSINVAAAGTVVLYDRVAKTRRNAQ